MRFRLGYCTIRYIYDTFHLNIICLISYFDIFTFFRVLFPLQHICYYFNKPTPYYLNLTLSIVYIFTIYLPFLRPINHNYSRFLFDYISYSANNTGRRCAVIIYRHKGKCDVLIIIILIYCLSRQVPLYPHVVYCLRIYNKSVVLTTDKPQLFTVVVLFHHVFYQQYGRTLHLCYQPKQM